MKPLAVTFTFLLALSRNVFAQTYPAFQLSTDKLDVGREIQFVYTGAFSRKIDPRITMYYTVNDHLRWKTLNAKYNGTAITGSLVIPDSTQSIEIKAGNGRDTTESFVFNISKNNNLGNGIGTSTQKPSSNLQDKNTIDFNRDGADLIKNKIPAGDFLKALTAMEIKYPKFVAEGKFDPFYALIAQKLFKQGDIKNAEGYVAEIRFRHIQAGFYFMAAHTILNYNSADLQLAETYIQRAIALVKFTPRPYYVFDQEQWNRMLNGTIGSYFGLSAQIQYKLGNVKEAINRLDSALSKAGYSNEIKERYLQYLLAAGENKTALVAAAKYIEQDEATESIKRLLKEAYTKENGGLEGYDNYYQALMKKAESQYVLPEYSKLNVPAIDFTLEDIQGKTVSLSDFKGKPVVLYFISTYYSTAQRDAFNSYFNEVVKAHSDGKITFLAITGGVVSEEDEANGRPQRIQKTTNFLLKNKLNFDVLMDSRHYDPHSTASSFYITTDNYGSDSAGQFYVIDKNKIVRYKSFPYSPMPIEKFQHELDAALKLVE